MSLPKKVTVSGAAIIGSAASCSGSGGCPGILNAEVYAQASAEFERALASPVSFVDFLAGTGIAAVKFLFLRVTGGTIELRVSSAFGATQIIPVSGICVLTNPIAGSEFTAVALRGTAQVEFKVAGD